MDDTYGDLTGMRVKVFDEYQYFHITSISEVHFDASLLDLS